MKKKTLLTVTILSALVLAGCGSKKGSSSSSSSAPSWPDVAPLAGEKIADFSKGESEAFFGSDGWNNGEPFNAVWKKENISYSNNQMHLSIKDESVTADEKTFPYTAGEARSRKLYGYGDFEVRMKPSNEVGTVSTFFTYTDKWNVVDGEENKHDEIDIEFLGKDTTKVQFNYFVSGVGEHEYMYDLGFDASKEFHNYGFRWEADCITWLVDGKTAYQVKKTATQDLPSQAGRIMMSYWPSSAEGWSGKFNGNTSKTSDYEWVKCSSDSIYADGEEPVDPIIPDEGINWAEINPTNVDFSTGRTDLYTVTTNNGVTNIAYEQAGEYANVVGGGIAEAANANDLVSLTLKNNSASKAVVRVDVQGTTKQGNTDCLNTSAVAEGHSEIYTDLNWGGSKIELAANEEVQFIISYDVTTEARGAAKYLLLFVDSLQDGLVAHVGGSISVSNVKFANSTGEPITPYTPGTPDPVDPDTPETPDEPDETWDPISATDLDFVASDASIYTVAKSEGVTTVTYSAAGNWSNVNVNVSEIANQNDTVRVTLKNNSSSPSKIRVDIQGTTTVGNTDCLNVSATAAGHTDVYTDTTWGGSSITLAANEKVHLVITYNTHTDKGAARNLLVFIDSTQGTSEAHEGGNIEIRAVKFAKLGEDPIEPEEEGLALSYSGNEEYTLDPANTATKSVTASYTAVGGSSYKNFGAGLAPEAVEGADTLNFKIKNNGEATVKVRVDIQGSATVGNTNAINVSASAPGHNEIWTDTTWGGTSIEVAAAEEVVLTVVFDQTTERGAAQYLMFFLDSARGDAETYAGNVTLSNFAFSATPVQQNISLTFSDQTAYVLDTVNTATETLNVTYTGIAGNSYSTFYAGFNPEDIAEKTSFSVTLKNNGEEQMVIRVDILNGDTKLNASASAPGHSEVYTDLQYGGSYITLAANETVTFTIVFDQSALAAQTVMFFVDSATWNDEATHSGSLTLSNFALA